MDERKAVPSSTLVNIQLTAGEGALVRVMLEAALDQYNHSSYEERNDARLKIMAESFSRLIPLLPSLG